MSGVRTRSKDKSKTIQTKRKAMKKKPLKKSRKRIDESSSEDQLEDRRFQAREEEEDKEDEDQDENQRKDNSSNEDAEEDANPNSKTNSQKGNESGKEDSNNSEDEAIATAIEEAKRRSMNDINKDKSSSNPFLVNGKLDLSAIAKKTKEVKNNRNLRVFDGTETKSWLANFRNMTSFLPEFNKREILYEKINDTVRKLFDERFINGIHNYSIVEQVDWLLSTYHAEKTSTQVHLEAQSLIWKSDTVPFITFYNEFLLATPFHHGFNDTARKILLHSKLPNLLQILSNPVIQNATLYEFVDWIKANEHLKLQIPVLTGAAPVNAVASASKPSVERLEVHDVNAIGLTRDRSDRPGIRGKPNYNDRKSGRWCSNCRMNNHWTRDCWHSEENRNRRPNKFRRGNDNQRYRNERNDRDERKDRDRRDHYKHRDNRDRRNYDKSHKDPREHDTRERPRKITKKETHSSDSSNNEVTRDKDKR
jgi:hypothetical protein